MKIRAFISTGNGGANYLEFEVDPPVVLDERPLGERIPVYIYNQTTITTDPSKAHRLMPKSIGYILVGKH